MKFVPFTVHVRVTPARGKRFEYLRDLAKLSSLVYNAIVGISGVHVATPGGGQNIQSGDENSRGGLGSFANATAAKPQIGNAPAQLMLTGFYESTGVNAPTYANTQRFSGGEVYNGQTQHSNDALPAAAVTTEVGTLKAAMEAAIAVVLPSGVVATIFRMDYQGVLYGDKGFHFPQ